MARSAPPPSMFAVKIATRTLASVAELVEPPAVDSAETFM